MLRVTEHLAGRALLDDAAGVHDSKFVAEIADEAEIVTDENNGGVLLGADLAEETERINAKVGVQRRRRLVGDHYARFRHQDHRDRQALTHPATQLMWEQIQHVIRFIEPKPVKERVGAIQRLFPIE
jgi:hypothetical protein